VGWKDAPNVLFIANALCHKPAAAAQAARVVNAFKKQNL
jgi:hypothetical protein